MNSAMYEAFGDELTKIAVMGAISRGFKSALKEGWQNSGGWMAGKGAITKRLPLGGKSLTVASTAVQAPGAFAREDPAGQGRSRTERVMGLAGDTTGQLAGTGLGNMAATRAANALKLTRGRGALGMAGMIGGAIAGGMVGKKVLTAPSKFLREHRQRQAIGQQEMPPEQGIV